MCERNPEEGLYIRQGYRSLLNIYMMLEQLNSSDLRGPKDEKLLMRQSMGRGWLEPEEIKGSIIAK